MAYTPTDPTVTLKTLVAQRFVRVNGAHPMTSADDAYVNAYLVPLETLAARHAVEPDQARAHILAGLLPLPGYLRTDGTEMLPANYFAVVEQAGGAERLESWFRAQWPTPQDADTQWADYVNGHYVCLREPVPEGMRRKDELVDQIALQLVDPKPASDRWCATLHSLVDELDALEPPFAPYDRLRFGGPVSRDRSITEVRNVFPRPARQAAR